jgi:hypothetical protein
MGNTAREYRGAMDTQVSTVILVEGESDRLAIQTLATRLGRDLRGDGVEVVAMGGLGNLHGFLARFGREGPGVRVTGLYDVGEEAWVRRALERAGYGSGPSRTELERLGFFVCVVDLEDELIRALGAQAVLRVIETQGELEALRTFQQQPAWRGRPIEEQLRRFFGTFSGRKIRMAPLLVDALDLDRIPRPFHAVLEHV